MPRGQKHLVPCRCILPQFKKAKRPPVHQFVVFSVIEDDDSVVEKYAQCNNCGAVHRVTDLGKSTVLTGRDHMASILTIDDIKLNLPDRLIGVLERMDADLPTWEAAQFIMENEEWGNYVIAASEQENGVRHGKMVRILGENTFKVENFSFDHRC